VRTIVLQLDRRVKMEVRRLRRETKDKGLALRCQVVLLADKGRRRGEIAEGVGCSVSWVNRIVARFHADGIAGLLDRREDNGQVKLGEHYLALLYDLVAGSPQDYGYARPTWTRELLAELMRRFTGVKVHPATMSRALKQIGARRGRPKPTVGCPWSKIAKNRRISAIQSVVQTLAPGEAAVYLDEVDIHLNPKIGLDWMNRGQQKEVLTPGNNDKRYLCGALDARTGLLTWAKAEKKNSILFIAMLRKLADEAYPGAKVIHVVLDNYKIHKSQITQAAVRSLGGRVVLHFLPPYSPDDNKIERTWLDLHANVTRNHTCGEMKELMRNVLNYLVGRNARRRAELARQRQMQRTRAA
jgi:transposase